MHMATRFYYLRGTYCGKNTFIGSFYTYMSVRAAIDCTASAICVLSFSFEWRRRHHHHSIDTPAPGFVVVIIRLILLTHTLETPPTLIFSEWLMLIRCGSGWLVKLLGWVGLISIQLINPKRKYEFKKNKNMKIPNIRGLMTRRLIKKYIK